MPLGTDVGSTENWNTGIDSPINRAMSSGASNILAKSVFKSGPDEKLAVVDIYKQKDIAPVNSIQDKTSTFSDTKSLAVRGSQFLKGVLPAAMQLNSLGQVLKYANDPKQKLLAVLGSSTSIFGSLSKDYQSKISGYLGQTPAGMSKLMVTVGGVTRQVTATNFSNIQSTASLLGSLSNNPGLVGVQDPDSKIALFSGITNEAARLRMPTSFGMLAGQLNNSQLINKFAKQSLGSVVQSGDAKALKDMATSTSPSTVNLLNPNVVSDFSSNYTLPLSCTAEQYDDQYGDVMDAFRSVDTKWDVISRSPEDTSTVNLTPLTDISEDMDTVLRTGYTKPDATSTEIMYSLASKYPKEDVFTTLRQRYPGVVLTTTGNSYNNSVINTR